MRCAEVQIGGGRRDWSIAAPIKRSEIGSANQGPTNRKFALLGEDALIRINFFKMRLYLILLCVLSARRRDILGDWAAYLVKRHPVLDEEGNSGV
jgi:hypothetical protein